MERDSALPAVRALTFDIFGTTVDWLTGVAAEARRLGALGGVEADWMRLAGAWRAVYGPSMDRVRRGDLPWTNFDRLHRMSLDPVLREVGAEGFDPAAREQLTHAWERLPAWPDAAPGLRRLAKRFTVATLSNGNRSHQAALVRFPKLPFQRLLSAQDFRHYKPALRFTSARPGARPDAAQVMMVASHKSDLRAAQAVGMQRGITRAAFSRRGPAGGSPADPLADVQAANFMDLADRLGC
jgi:2-haloacid dehalogenase